MELEHYSANPEMDAPKDFTQTYNKPGWGFPMKPEGLWVSVRGDDDWPSWCKGENFRLEALRYRHRVILAKAAKLKIITSAAELVKFDGMFGVDWQLGEIGYGVKRHPFHMRRIDWPKLAETVDGIIIAPYIWELRLSGPGSISDWYYPWDCASGCIWNGHAIERFELLEEVSID